MECHTLSPISVKSSFLLHLSKIHSHNLISNYNYSRQGDEIISILSIISKIKGVSVECVYLHKSIAFGLFCPPATPQLPFHPQAHSRGDTGPELERAQTLPVPPDPKTHPRERHKRKPEPTASAAGARHTAAAAGRHDAEGEDASTEDGSFASAAVDAFPAATGGKHGGGAAAAGGSFASAAAGAFPALPAVDGEAARQIERWHREVVREVGELGGRLNNVDSARRR